MISFVNGVETATSSGYWEPQNDVFWILKHVSLIFYNRNHIFGVVNFFLFNVERAIGRGTNWTQRSVLGEAMGRANEMEDMNIVKYKIF